LILHRRAIRLLYASLLSAGAIYANGQTCDGKNAGAIATDRPQVTNSSIVVPCGSLQFENGLEQSGSARRQGFDLPETSIRLGIAKRLELRFAPPIYFNNVDSGSAFASGGGDSVLGLKLQLGPVHGFDVSVIPSVSLPTGTSAISSHGYDPALQIPWSRSLTKVWTVAGQLSVLAPTQGSTRNVSGQASLYFDRALGSVWDAYLEYSGIRRSATHTGLRSSIQNFASPATGPARELWLCRSVAKPCNWRGILGAVPGDSHPQINQLAHRYQGMLITIMR